MGIFNRRHEQRAHYYSPAVEDALYNAALVGRSDASQTAAATSAIHSISDAFAVASVTPSSLNSLLNPAFMVDMARRLLLSGNALYMIDVDDAEGLSLVPYSTFEVAGGYRPCTWLYRLELPRPSGSPVVRSMPAEGVVHVRVGARPASPWQGVSPLREAGLTSDALANLDRSLGMDTSPPAGLLMAVPDGASQGVVDQAATAITKGKGGLSLLQTTAGGYGQGKAAAPSGPAADYRQIRFGPMVPETSIKAHTELSNGIMATMGVSAQRFTGDGAGMREAYRLTVLGPVQALGAICATELTQASGQTVIFNFDQTKAIGTGARARGVKLLVDAGLSMDAALDAMGLT